MKIDVHTHMLPKSWPDLRERYGYGGFVRLEHHKPCCAKMMVDDQFFREVGDQCWSPDRRLQDCDADAVDIQVLSTVPVMFSYWAKPEHTHDLSQLLNDHLAGVVRDRPDRFVALGTLPMQDPQRAITELERCVNQLEFPGVQIGTHVNGWNLDHPAVFDVLQAAADLGAAVFVHPWDMMGRERMSSYWLGWLVGMPAETSLAICSILFGGVLERIDNLRIGFAHGGGAFPFTLGRIEHAYNVRPDLCAVNSTKSPSEHIGKFYVDSLVHDEEALRLLIAQLGAESITLGSDYPFPLGEQKPGSLVESMNELTDHVRRRLLAGTAVEFLGLQNHQSVKEHTATQGHEPTSEDPESR